MKTGRALRTLAALGGIPLTLGLLSAGTAHAHGTVGDPASRIASCYAEGPEGPQSEVCKSMVAANGTQALYDWNEVNIADAAGQHRQIIPDGRLCSAGRDKYSGLDAPGAWPTTTLPASGSYTFEYTVTAPHAGYFELYVTKDGWDQSQRLTWGALEDEPFLVVHDPQNVGGTYQLPGAIPQGKSGQHVVYAIWQRTDSPEAFYSCSDVNFGGAPAESGSATAEEPIAFEPEETTGTEHHDHDHGDGYGAEEDTAEEVDPSEEPEEEPSEQPEAKPVREEQEEVPALGAHEHASGEEHLASTGAAVTGWFLLALGLLATGFAATVLIRRKHAAGV